MGTERDLVEVMTGFAHALREAGVAADRARLTTCLTALGYVDVHEAEDVYWACRLTLCSEPDDLPRFDALFDRWFRGLRPVLTLPGRQPDVTADQWRQAGGPSPSGRRDDELEEGGVLATAATDAEILHQQDVGALSDAERDEINRLVALLSPRMGRRRTLRRMPSGRARGGRIDVARTVRLMLREGGEPARLVFSRRRDKPRRLVMLLDVSGSMSPYADLLLRFAHAAVRVAPRTTEVFTVSTRLTRVTRQLRTREPEQALQAARSAVPDWVGGTRLGDSLRAFLDVWGQRGVARQAVVVVVSDGWERGDPALLGEQMARLARLAHRVVWVNPHRGKGGFSPTTGGMVAALPAIDDLVAGHSFESMRDLAEVIARA